MKYKSLNGYSGEVRECIDEYYNNHIQLVIYNPNKEVKALFVLNEMPRKEELQHLIDNFPRYIEFLKEGERHE